MKPFLDIVERQPMDLPDRYKDDGGLGPCRSLKPQDVKSPPAPKEEKRPIAGSSYQWDRRR